MSLSIQRSIVEEFHFNDQKVRSVHIQGKGECLVSTNASKAVGYNDADNARKAIQTHVPETYRMRLGDIKNILKGKVNIDLPQEDRVLLKEPGFYYFLLRCKKDEAELFMEWAVETVLPRAVRKLASAIEERDSPLQDHDNQMQAIQYDNV